MKPNPAMAQFLEAMQPPAAAGACLTIGDAPACGCGCGRPAAVFVVLGEYHAVLDTPAKVDAMIASLARCRDRRWPRRGPRAWLRRLAGPWRMSP